MAEKLTHDRILTIAAVVAAVAGLVMSSVVAFRVKDRWRTVRQYSTYSSRLADMERTAERGVAAVKLFQELSNPHPVPVADLARESLEGQRYDSSEQPQRETTIPGWALRQVEISFPEIALTQLAAFMAQAESQRPPWRLAACTIRSLSQSGGIGNARLTLEALEKSE